VPVFTIQPFIGGAVARADAAAGRARNKKDAKKDGKKDEDAEDGSDQDAGATTSFGEHPPVAS
jgi:hypothetical protein